MKNKTIIIIISILIIIGISCKEETGSNFFIRNQISYFPINIGNEWKYVGLKVEGDTLVVRIKGYMKYSNQWYALFENVIPRKDKEVKFNYYWTYGNNGDIIYLDSTSTNRRIKVTRTIRYYTNCDTGNQWTFKINEENIKLSSKNDSILINGVWFHDCLKYKAGIHDEYLARGIGLINDSYFMLFEYKINGEKPVLLNPKIGKIDSLPHLE